jgi:hypothetical protein
MFDALTRFRLALDVAPMPGPVAVVDGPTPEGALP